MKLILFALVLLFLVLQYEFLFANGGLITTLRLKHSIEQQQQSNEKLEKRDAVLQANIVDLKKGNEAVEGQARNELGMVKQGEIFYQVVKK